MLRAVALADPTFGGGASLEASLWSPDVRPAGDPVARAAFVRQWRQRADADALELVRELVSADLAMAVADFVRSPAAAAFWAAEQRVLHADPQADADLVAALVAACTDSQSIGAAGWERFAAQVLAAGGEPLQSSSARAVEWGAACIAPEEAHQIVAFATTPVGAEWFELSATAMARAQSRRAEFRAEARRLGFLHTAPGFCDLDGLALPGFLPAAADLVPVEITIALDAANRWCVDGEPLASPSDQEGLRAALRTLRERCLASGRFTTESIDIRGRTILAIRESVSVHAPKGASWQAVDRLLKACSDPEVAIHRLQLDVDPASIPPQIR